MQQFGDAELGLGQLQLGWLLLALAVIAVARAGRPLGRLAADLQVHVGGRRHRPAAADLRVRQRRQRRAAHAVDRAAVRPAVGAAEGDPRRVPRGVPVGEPLPARRREHADRAASACRRSRTSRRWSRCWRSRSAIVVVQRDLGAALLFFAVFLALLYVATGRPSYVVGGLILFIVGVVGPVQPVRPRPAAGRQLARPVRATRWAPASRPSRRCTRSRAAGCSGVGPRRRAADDRRAPADPGGPHGLPARGAGRGAGPDRAARDPRAVPRRRRARAADRRRGARRLPGAARRRASRSSSASRRSSSPPATSSSSR